MKYIAILAAFAVSALAQGINIAAPAANSQVYRGEYITVELDKEVRAHRQMPRLKR